MQRQAVVDQTASGSHSPYLPGLAGTYATTDFDAFAGHAAPGWEQRYRKLGRAPFRATLVQAHTASMQIGRVGWATTVGIEGRIPSDSIAFVLPAGRGAAMLSGSALDRSTFGAISAGREFHACTGSLSGVYVLCMALPRWQALVHAFTGFDADALPVAGDASAVRLTDVAGAAADLGRILDRALLQPAGLADAAAGATMELSAVAAILGRLEERRLVSVPKRPGQLAQRAESWLRASIHQPVHITDLCAALDTNARTLHHVFRRTYAMTPMAYLRALRLDEVRRDLRNGRCGSVTEAATRWGFYHFGAFAGHYRRHFGELPSQTLASSRR